MTKRPGTGAVVPSAVAPASRARRTAAFAAWLALLGGAVLTLHAGGAALPGPPLLRPSAWPRWAAGRDPVVVAFAVVRLLALAGAGYGLVVTVAGVALRVASAEHLASLVDRITVGPIRRVVAATVAVGISTGPLAAAGARPLPGQRPEGPPGGMPVPATAPAGPSSPADGVPPVTVTMHLLDPGAEIPPSPAPSTSASPSPSVSATEEPRRPQTVVEAPATWTVRPGECFWSIADDVLGGAWGRAPTDAEIVPYWRRLIDANRAVLSDPDNPDLVFPGQVFSLPEV